MPDSTGFTARILAEPNDRREKLCHGQENINRETVYFINNTIS
jgi:hypothetical protein